MSPFDDTDVVRSADLAPSDLAPVELEEALGRRRPRRKRVLGAIIAVLLCASFIAVIGYPLVGRIIPVSASPSTNQSAFRVVVATNITTAGVFTVNGQKQPERMAVNFTPRDGDNTVILDVPPFARHICHFSWIDHQTKAISGQCQPAGDSFVSDPSGTHDREDDIAMPLVPADLPSGLQQAATDAIGRLASPAQMIVVPEGDYYALGLSTEGTILSQRAAVPLTATFSIIPEMDNLEPITLFLDEPRLTQHFPDRAWLMRASMLDSWSFSTPDGALAGAIASQVSLERQIEFALDYTQPSFSPLPFDIYGGTFNPPDTFPCQKGLQVLQQFYSGTFLIQSPSDCIDHGLAGSAFSVTFAGIGSSVGATHLSAVGGRSDATTAPSPPRFLYRFGVLLAANAAAHVTAPDLPQAPANEIYAIAGS